MFEWLSKFVFPVVRAQEEEDLVDQQDMLKGICHEKSEAKVLWEKYTKCNERVSSRSQTTENCEEELFDYLDVINHCVSKDLFKKLK